MRSAGLRGFGVWAIAALAVGATLTTEARAQESALPRFVVAVNAGTHGSPGDFAGTSGLPLNVEDGAISADYAVSSGTMFDISGGARLSRRLWIGVAFSRFSTSGDTEISASLPHPFFFDQFRSVSGQASDVEHVETGIHIQVQWVLPLTGRVELRVGAGPTLYKLRQGLVSDIVFTEAYPFDSATFSSATLATSSTSAIGFNTAVNLSFLVRRNISLGALARFSRADMDVEAASGDTIAVRAGGLELGGGVRFQF